MKLYLGNSIRLPLRPTLRVIQQVPARMRLEPSRRLRLNLNSARRRLSGKS
jgi:hypothetical protein